MVSRVRYSTWSCPLEAIAEWNPVRAATDRDRDCMEIRRHSIHRHNSLEGRMAYRDRPVHRAVDSGASRMHVWADLGWLLQPSG